MSVSVSAGSAAVQVPALEAELQSGSEAALLPQSVVARQQLGRLLQDMRACLLAHAGADAASLGERVLGSLLCHLVRLAQFMSVTDQEQVFHCWLFACLLLRRHLRSLC